MKENLCILGAILLEKLKNLIAIIIVLLIAFVMFSIIVLAGMGIAAIFFGATQEILTIGGISAVVIFGMVICIIKCAKGFLADFRAEKSRRNSN